LIPIKFVKISFSLHLQPAYSQKSMPVENLAVASSDTIEPSLSSRGEDLAERFRVLEAMVESVSAGVWDWNMVTNEEYLSPRFKEMFGYRDDELPNAAESWMKLIFPEDLEMVKQDLEKHIQTRGKHPYARVVRYRHRNGSTVHVLCAGKIISWSPTGEPLRMVGSHVDMTAQVEAELRARRLSDLLARTNRAAKIGAWEWDQATNGIWWSDVTREIHEEPPGFTPTVEGGIHYYLEGPDRERLRSHFQHALATGEGYDLELRIRTAKGRICWVRAVGQPEMENGQAVRVSGVFQDITERRELMDSLSLWQEQFSGFFENSPFGIASNDFATGQFLQFNKALIEPTGYTSEEFKNLTYFQLTPEKYLADEEKMLAMMRETGRYGPFEKEYIRKDGSRYPVLLNGFTVTDSSGRKLIWSIIQDITEQSRNEALIIQKTQELEAAVKNARILAGKAESANRAKSAFLATMSHEIRTPLNGIIGANDLLAQTELTDGQRELVQMALSSGEVLLSTISDILDFSTIEAGQLELHTEDFHLLEEIGKVLDTLGPTANRKGLDLAFIPSPNTPALVHGDRTRLRQILVNLVGNAIKFTRQGHVLIDCQKGTSGTLIFAVKDTGVGISKHLQPRLFKAFSQADSSTTREFGGTGLGLAICKRLCQLLGGDISVESEPGKGSTFRFEIPLQTAGNAATSTGWAQQSGQDLSGQTILVVDDHEVNLRVATMAIEASGGSTLLAENIASAVDQLRLHRQISLILLDHFLPDGSVQEALRQLRDLRNGHNIPIILLTSDASQVDRAPFAAILQKPIKVQVLTAMCARYAVTTPTRTAKSQPVPSPVEERNPSWASKKVLLVEDNAINQLVIRGLLESFGIKQVTLAENGQVALDMVARAESTFDLILMDCQMPVLDGLEATRRLRAREKGELSPKLPPIVGLSAGALTEEIHAAMDSGMDAYLTKPLHREDFQAFLQKTFG
jgi:two-component system, sensor histidine kinase and response regulator